MDRKAVFDEVVAILRPFAKNRAALESVRDDTSILRDLKVNSARFVEVVARLEERYELKVTDDDVDRVRTVGDVVAMVERLRGTA
jgi:acyl carrier protein